MTQEATSAQLLGMFHFKGKPPPTQQSTSDVAGFVKLLSSHCENMAVCETLPACENTLNINDCQPVLEKASSLMRDGSSIKWFPAHGAALIAIGSPSVQGGPIVRRHLSVVGLDQWTFRPHWLHPSSGSSELSHGSIAGGASIIDAGTVEEKDLPSLFDNLEEAMKGASQRHGEERTAAFGKPGHQCTPAMILALLQDAKVALHSSKPPEHLPAGGFTDVGLHTGGSRRATAWSLTREVFQVILTRHAGGRTSECTRVLEQGKLGVLFNLVVADFHLSLLEERLPALSGSAEDVNEGIEMLQHCVLCGGYLVENGHDMAKYVKRIETVRETLVDVAASQMMAVAERYTLPDGSCFDAKDIRLPEVVLPSPPHHTSAGEGGIAAVKARSDMNLFGLPSISAEGKLTPQRVDDLISWAAEECPGKGDLHSHFVLREIEALLFATSADQRIQEASKAFGNADTKKLVQLVELHRSVLSALLSGNFCGGPLKVELWSRETLVVWIAYAVGFAAARDQNPESMTGFGVCLDPQDIKHLVLSNKLAVDAALKVADFLRSNTRHKNGVFTLADQGGATFRLAATAAKSWSWMRDTWAREITAAKRRCDEHWRIVQKLRRERTEIRGKVQRCESALRSQQLELETARAEIAVGECTCYSSRHTCHACERVSNAASAYRVTKKKIEGLKQRLEETKATPPVLQPLPEDETAAYQVLFFLWMPEVFRSLSHLSFQAQQMLLPREWDESLTAVVQQPDCPTFWASYYNSHQSSVYHTPLTANRQGHDGAVKLGFCGSLGEPEKMVDHCSTRSDGVWHPDASPPGRMVWQGGDFSADKRSFPFDPFSSGIRPEWLADGYTEQLGGPDSRLQWAMSQYGIDKTSCERGNLAMATMDDRPEWLRRSQYVEFGKVRAYPLTQCHQLALVLKDRSLPLSRPAVRTLVQQALFQIGDVSMGRPTMMLWRQEEADSFAALFHELKIRIEEIEHTPREHLAMQLVVIMAVYVGDWHRECRVLARSRLVEISRQWALGIDNQLQEATHTVGAAISSLKAKQCLFYMYGILCFDGSAALSATDVSNLCELSALAYQCRVFTEDKELAKESSALQVRCVQVVATRIHEIVEQAEADPSFITTVVRCVLEDAPEDLSWAPVAGRTACFNAEFRGHLFSANLLTGIVLYDGVPPSLLPGDIVENRHYQRLFGTANFEVTMDAHGVFKTARSIGGRFYEFRSAPDGPDPSGEVVIEEIDKGHGERLQALRHDGAWAKELPVRLRTMHSHWLCRARSAVVARSKDFRERDVMFILKCNKSGDLASCYHVPPHLSSRSVKEVSETVASTVGELGSKGELVLLPAESSIVTALAKFEPHATGPDAVIHAYRQPGGEVKVELPRFELEFEVARALPRQQAGFGGSGIRCLSHRGYELACCQQLDDTLPNLSRYLVLVREDGDTKVVVPCGKVVVGQKAVPCKWVERDDGDQGHTSHVGIECDNEGSEDAELKVFYYAIHRRWGQLDAVGVSARLQLAAMFAATDSMLPDPRAGMTGSEKASELIRSCFVSHPLQQDDRTRLLRVLDLSGMNPALALLCGDLLESSAGLGFLHKAKRIALPPGATIALEHAGTVYVDECDRLPWHRRRRLTVAEEERVLGGQVPMKSNPQLLQHRSVKPPRCPVEVSDVNKAEADVKREKGIPICSAHGNETRPYPLKVPQDADTLTGDMHEELLASWQAHKLAGIDLASFSPTSIHRLHGEFTAMRRGISTKRERVEEFLLSTLTCFGSSTRATADYMNRVAGLVPTASVTDLPPILWEKERMHQLNPFLAEDSLHELLEGITTWLRLCVLEDKLARLHGWTKISCSQTQALVRQELDVVRTWDPVVHPTWLAFEVDAGLQIRPHQAEVALHMIGNPGDIVQLNMGEGKTRVILPLLLLHWAIPSEDTPVVRLHFLSSLIAEAYDFLHHALTGSLLRRKLFLMPFDRDVQLTLEEAQVMRGFVERCRDEGGALLVTPEHRQSLNLKRLELRGTDPDASTEMEKLEGMMFRDLYDESDELLHHRRQLIYAVGGLHKLPAQVERAHAVQALLRALKHRERYPRLDDLLSDSDIAVEEVSSRPEQFNQLRLLPGQALDEFEPELRRELLEAVLSDPPYEMQWVKATNTKIREQILDLVLKEDVGAQQALEKASLSEEGHWDQLMALRGLLAKGLLVHCLQMRPRVQYGVSREVGAKKRLAIPFRASNTPADRSEFKEPTLAIIVTVLSYYYDGLSLEQLREALTTLLEENVAESAQADYYNAWLAETRPSEEEMEKMDDVHKVDLTNGPQMKLLHKHFGRNFEVINFWLNSKVLPAETQLCPRYIGSNSWFLADNPIGAISGFSGTNDNHRLLPLQVQKNPEGSLPSLSGTNGKMLDLMMRNERYITLEAVEGIEVWKWLLHVAMEQEADALVDCGAVLGRVSSEDAAVFLLSSEGGLSGRFRGVVFFDASRGTAAAGGEWVVRNRVGRTVALSGSPIQASEAFSIYDEARCRGADLKLSADAKALLTIGPKNGKDKIMQAAGRLRLLGRSNQSIVFVGTADVSAKIREVARLSDGDSISSGHVLSYAMDNTVVATRSGLPQWARQGLRFSEVFDRVERAEQEEVMTLDAAYGAAFRQVTVADTVSTAVARQEARFGVDVHMPSFAGRIGSRAERYGKTAIVSRDADIGGECEREMELEIEEEEEEERQAAKVVPRAEVDWDYDAALSASSIVPLRDMAEVTSLGETWKQLDGEASTKRIRKEAKTVFCTRNFFFAVETDGSRGSQDQYLRPVDWALAFAEGGVLLISEREANGVLVARGERNRRAKAATPSQPSLIHISYAGSVQHGQAANTSVLMRDIMLDRGPQIFPALSSIWVFAGITTIPTDAREFLKTVVKGGRVAVKCIVTSRDRGHMLPRSDLERLLT